MKDKIFEIGDRVKFISGGFSGLEATYNGVTIGDGERHGAPEHNVVVHGGRDLSNNWIEPGSVISAYIDEIEPVTPILP